MVKIRYSELPAGLHVAVKTDGHQTVVYLLPGLTPAQRHAALTRVRRSALMGQGPSLPRFAMAKAVAADRVWVTARTGAAAMWRHPMLLLPPLMLLVSGVVVLVLNSSGNLWARHSPAVPSTVQQSTVGTGSSQSGGSGNR